MSNAWNIENLRKIAGNPIVESYEEDDDDMSPAEKALADKADSDLKKQGVKVKNVDPDKDMSKLSRKVGKKEEKAERNQEDAEDAEKASASVEAKKEKAEAPAANPKTAKKLERKAAAAEAESKKEKEEGTAKKGRKADDSSKIGQARTWLKNNPGAKRSEFLAYTDTIGLSRAYASGKLTQLRRGLTEFYMLRHPLLSSVYLAENYEFGSYQWADMQSPLEPLVFTTETSARELATHMANWKGLDTVIEHFIAEEADEAAEARDKDAMKKVSAATAWLKDHPAATRAEFAAHCKDACGWSAHTANAFFETRGKADKKSED